MTGIEAALWGLFGGFAVEGLDLYVAVRRRGCWPWQTGKTGNPGKPREAGPLAYVVAEVIRLLVGGGIAWAAATSGQVSTPVAALAVGIATPLLVERLTRFVPLPVETAERSVVAAPSNTALEENTTTKAGGQS
jgi:hypothetical protein